ncbi:F-box protein 27, isoform CRA_b [Mus musculus]|nr:F-box protein 27, isoform CRA_b [Mus musculus]
MGAWISRTRVPTPEPDPQEVLDLSRLPPELLLLVLSHVPPRTLLMHCRRVCRAWRALVDGQALWLLLLARDHSAAGRALLTLARRCLPPAHEDTPCPLGQFCALRPLGRNLISNPCGQAGVARSRSWTWWRRVCGQSCWTVVVWRLLSLTGHPRVLRHQEGHTFCLF